MADTVIRGTKSFQVPEYFNFADVIDEWAQKEKVKTDAIKLSTFLFHLALGSTSSKRRDKDRYCISNSSK